MFAAANDSVVVPGADYIVAAFAAADNAVAVSGPAATLGTVSQSMIVAPVQRRCQTAAAAVDAALVAAGAALLHPGYLHHMGAWGLHGPLQRDC